MDNRSGTTTRAQCTGVAPRKHTYASHGPWPVILATLLFIKFGWCLKLCYGFARGDLTNTPAEKCAHIVTSPVPLSHLLPTALHLDLDRVPKRESHRRNNRKLTRCPPQALFYTAETMLELLVFPGIDLFLRHKDVPWPTAPWLFFATSFVWSMVDAGKCITIALRLHDLPSWSAVYDGFYITAREYRAWRTVDMPLLALLDGLTALLIVVNCATWLRWDHERRRVAAVQADVELRQLRLRTMFHPEGAESGSGGMVTGVVPRGEDGAKRGEV